MDTREKALQFVKNKGFPFWKLYRGNLRVSQCEIGENETLSQDEAVHLFQQEMEQERPEGLYAVNVYKNSRGDKAGVRFEFRVENQQQSPSQTTTFNRGGMDHQMFVQFIQDQLLQKQANERIEKKLDALLESVLLLSDGDKDNDDDIKKLIMPLLATWIGKAKTASVAVPAAAAVTRGAFN